MRFAAALQSVRCVYAAALGCLACACACLAGATSLTGAAAHDLHFVVASDGSGEFKTIQYAVDHALDHSRLGPDQRLVLEIRPGRYQERVKIPPDRPRLTILGIDAAKTIISSATGAKNVGGTFFSSTVEVDAPDFEAANVSFENSYGVGTQAVAITVHSDRAVFEKCRFLGWQDTLYAATGRQYYRDCYIEGHIDFIFGNAAAVFERCEIHSRRPGYIAAESRLTPDSPTAFVFLRCRVTGDDTGDGVFLGRPWRDYSRVVYIDCCLGAQIRPEGWSDWTGMVNRRKTAWYGEYGSIGPGAKADHRVAWVHKLTTADVAQFQPDVFLRGDDGWQPEKTAAKLAD